ncbi:MAG: hypothetical protein Q9207_008172, partial [Kuettlingeria erythrocarpa]
PSSPAAGLRISRTVRPGTAGGAAASLTRRHSIALNAGVAADDESSVEQLQKGGQQQQQQQQSKRLSVGAIGRSASLKIKEGFGRKK